nr:MAG TPA: hypothetical protein [Bacteriophage sp.]
MSFNFHCPDTRRSYNSSFSFPGVNFIPLAFANSAPSFINLPESPLLLRFFSNKAL